MLEAEKPQGLAWLKGLGELKKFISSGLEPTTFIFRIEG
jgi:hypothetical protein